MSSSSSASSSCASLSPSSSVSSTLSGRMHAASLVDEALHSPDLLELVDVKVTRPVIAHVVDRVSQAVASGLDGPKRSSRGRPTARASDKDAFADFVSAVIRRSDVKMPVILGTLVYIQRASRHLRIAIEEWAHHRVFLGALILASKYLNDSSLKNAHWALCTGTFGKRDVGRIEREFLEVLDFELAVREEDLMEHYDAIMDIISSSPSSHRRSQQLPSHVHFLDKSPRSLPHSASHPHTQHRARDTDVDMSSPSSSADSASPRTPPPLSHPIPHTPYHKHAGSTGKHVSHHHTTVPSMDLSHTDIRELYESFPVQIAPSIPAPDSYSQHQKHHTYLPFTKIPLRSVASFGAHPWANMASVA